MCALINKYYSTAIIDTEGGQDVAEQMCRMWRDENTLERYLRELSNERSLRWSKYNAEMCIFPEITKDDLCKLTFGKWEIITFIPEEFSLSGSHQIKMAKSYILDHFQQSYINDEEVEFIVELCEGHDDLVRAKFQSRHSNHKKHTATVRFDEAQEQPIVGWYCTCSSGSREVGMCSHTTALLWHLGIDRARTQTSTHPLATANLLNGIEDSMDFAEEEYAFSEDETNDYTADEVPDW